MTPSSSPRTDQKKTKQLGLSRKSTMEDWPCLVSSASLPNRPSLDPSPSLPVSSNLTKDRSWLLLVCRKNLDWMCGSTQLHRKVIFEPDVAHYDNKQCYKMLMNFASTLIVCQVPSRSNKDR